MPKQAFSTNTQLGYKWKRQGNPKTKEITQKERHKKNEHSLVEEMNMSKRR
jgi:hypothetical protein